MFFKMEATLKISTQPEFHQFWYLREGNQCQDIDECIPKGIEADCIPKATLDYFYRTTL